MTNSSGIGSNIVKKNTNKLLFTIIIRLIQNDDLKKQNK